MHLYSCENCCLLFYIAYVRPCRVVFACLFVYLLFYTALLLLVYFFPLIFFILTSMLYFWTFVNRVNKSIIFIFGDFVYHFKNAISIFIKIFLFYFARTLQTCFIWQKSGFWIFSHKIIDYPNNLESILKIQSFLERGEISFSNAIDKHCVQTYMLLDLTGKI